MYHTGEATRNRPRTGSGQVVQVPKPPPFLQKHQEPMQWDRLGAILGRSVGWGRDPAWHWWSDLRILGETELWALV